MESFPWFLAFWQWAKKESFSRKKHDLLLARIGEKYWRDWFDDEARKYRTEINNLRTNTWAHQVFIAALKEWAQREWPEHPQTITWLLFALAHEKPFDKWEGLADYRQLNGLSGVSGIYLHCPKGGQAEDIRFTHCLLVPNLKPGAAQPVCYVNKYQELLTVEAKTTPQNALDALRNLLMGRDVWFKFLPWALLGMNTRWNHPVLRSADWALKWLGCLLIAALFCFLAFAVPWKYFTDETVLVPAALAFVGLSLLMMLVYIVAPILREWWRVKQQRQRWADFLSCSCVCIVFGDGEEIRVTGPSFGVALFFSTLLALGANSLEHSQLVIRLMEGLKRASESWAFTGGIRADGGISPINRLEDKIEAALACSYIERLIVPVQPETSEGVRTFERNRPTVQGEAQAAGLSPLHVHTYAGVMPLLRDLSGFRLRAPSWIMAMTLALWVFLAVLIGHTIYDVEQFASVPPDPTLSVKDFKMTDTSVTLWLRMDSEDPSRFAVRINSPYSKEPLVKQFSPVPESPTTGEVTLQLERQDGIRVELICPRRFSWRELPPTVIELSSLESLINRSSVR